MGKHYKQFYRIQKTNSLRCKVFEFMEDYPLASFQQMFNFLLEDYKQKIHDVIDFNNMLYVYRCQYWQQHGKPYTPPNDQLKQIRKGYEISLYPVEFTPDIEVVANKIIEDEDKELRRLNELMIALQSRRF